MHHNSSQTVENHNSWREMRNNLISAKTDETLPRRQDRIKHQIGSREVKRCVTSCNEAGDEQRNDLLQFEALCPGSRQTIHTLFFATTLRRS